ncbi:MAG: sulfotransferase [Bacteroidia bacterium]
MKLSFLHGADLPTLFRLFGQQRFRIDIRTLPVILLHFVLAVFNTLVSLPERFLRYENDPVKPVFILGHWRSGTTHLHNLLAADRAYHTPNTFQIAFPHAFMYSEKWLAPILSLAGPGVRPMDNMAMLMSTPNEEEIGMAALGAPSSYMAIHFPRNHEKYRTYLSFRDASEKDVKLWKKMYRNYLRKFVAKYGNDRPLLLKSPSNTARVPMLLEMYPDARFIHIQRNPYETIRSTLHLYDKWFEMANFQSLKALREGRDQYVLEVYEQMHRLWFEDRKLIPENHLFTIRFEDLKKSPVQIINAIYQFLGDTALDQKALDTYLDSIKSYSQNKFDPLSPEMILEINQRMAFVFEELGYPMVDSSEI